MYAEDLVNAILFVIGKMGELQNITNIGLGYDYSINEYYNSVADLVGFNGDFVHDLTKPAGMLRKLLNVDRQHELGWKPKYSLQEGIEKTYKYFLSTHG